MHKKLVAAAFNRGNTVLLISCKSRVSSQDNASDKHGAQCARVCHLN